MFINCIPFSIVNWDKFVMCYRKRLLKKCSNIVFVILGWLALWISHTSSSCVVVSGRSLLIDLICALAACLSEKSILVIGDFTHDCFLMRGMCCAPPILGVMYLVSPWYMILSFHGSFKASLSCLPMHLR